ncbi:MAG: hypothetical protein AAGJ73_15745 [Pseudomonadota bacterium]
MLISRVAAALKRQDWAVVAIEFALVIFGVLTALQVNNWNAARADRAGAASALNRLHIEVNANIAAADDRLAAIEGSADVRRAGVTALLSCDSSPEATKALGEALGNLTGDIIPSFVDNTLRELARQDRYLDLLSEEFRVALSVYSGRLSDEREQLKINFGLMWDRHAINHPLVGIEMPDGDALASQFAFSEPMEAMCKDTEFRRKLIMTEGFHQSTVLRLKRFKEWSAEFMTTVEAEQAAFR